MRERTRSRLALDDGEARTYVPYHARTENEPVSAFVRALRELSRGHAKRKRRWVFVPYDQLTDAIGPLAHEPPHELGIVVVEAPAKAARRPYHKQKLALVLTNLRHFALEQAARGVAVRHVLAAGDFASTLAPLAEELGPLRVMDPAERELREDLGPLFASGALTRIPHEGWLTSLADFAAAGGDRPPPWRMDRFYAGVRKRTGILMEGGTPVGGKMSHDVDNRRPWKGSPSAPSRLTFAKDDITREVVELVLSKFRDHPGRLDDATLPATRADAEAMLAWAETECLPSFGPFEDAMSTRSTGLFHTRLSPLINLHRLTPREVLTRVLAQDIDIASKEGFVRQLLGWREFVRHVHRATDGLRRIPGRPPTPDANPSTLGANRPLPPAYWGTRSGLACLDRVVHDVWDEGYSHHIPRLMVLAGIATLLDVSPRALTDWFWVAYTDAYDWVVEPNVLGMGTYATGDMMVTKPYIAGAAYTHRMSDHCSHCLYDPRKTCPLTPMYWAFLGRHATALAANPRMLIPLAALRKRTVADKARDALVFETVSHALTTGEPVPVDVVARSRAS